MSMIDKHMSFFNFLDELKQGGCAICCLLKKTIHKLMDDFLYERVNDPGVRNEIRQFLGFCPLHAWQLQKLGDPLGQAIIYDDLMELVVTRIEKIVASKKGIKKLPSQILRVNRRNSSAKLKIACPICKSKIDAETRYVSTFIESFNEPEFLSCYKSSFGLCLPHLQKVINTCKQKK